jgi:hypothetical protein
MVEFAIWKKTSYGDIAAFFDPMIPQKIVCGRTASRFEFTILSGRVFLLMNIDQVMHTDRYG